MTSVSRLAMSLDHFVFTLTQDFNNVKSLYLSKHSQNESSKYEKISAVFRENLKQYLTVSIALMDLLLNRFIELQLLFR